MPKGQKLTEHEENLLQKHYSECDLNWLSKQLNRNRHTIRELARKRGLKREPSVTEEHKQLIIKHYPRGDLKWLSQQVNKSIHTIQQWAHTHNIKREISGLRKGSLLPLLKNTYKSYYWLGMFAADGYISKDGHFMLSQCEKYKDQVYKLAQFLESKVYIYQQPPTNYSKTSTTVYRVNIYDKQLGTAIRSMFNIVDKKTYAPISLDFMEDYNLKNISFLIGLIDGDGSVYKDRCVIECHLSWMQTLQQLKTKMPLNIQSGIRVFISNNKGKQYAKLTTNSEVTKYLHKFIKKYKLPASIKWNTH